MIRAVLYLALALALLGQVFPNPFPFLLVAGFMALGAMAGREIKNEREDPE